MIAPLSGEIVAVNSKVVEEPETINEDPYGDGWLVRRLSDPPKLDDLLDVAAYRELLAAVSYLSLTDADRDAMLAAIGVASVDELFRDIPEESALDAGSTAASPRGARRPPDRAGRAERRHGQGALVPGAGIYDHYVPAVVDAVLSRGEFLTAYTPYQPEMSQGVLQAIFEYQTVICELTGMDVSNLATTATRWPPTPASSPSTYEADQVVLCETLNPQVRQVVKTYAPGFGLEVVEVSHRDGVTDPDELRSAAADAACVIFQQPNFFGCLELA